jgi:hypothetical protein
MFNTATPIKIYMFKDKSYVSAFELYQLIFPYTPTHYVRWVNCNITNQPQGLSSKGIDYILFPDAGIKPPQKIKGGKKRMDYLLSTIFAIQLCYQAKNFPAKNLKDFLLKMQ